MSLTMNDMEDVEDMQKEPWFCKKHNFQAIVNPYEQEYYYCPECDELICQAWDEVTEEGNTELGFGFPLYAQDVLTELK